MNAALNAVMETPEVKALPAGIREAVANALSSRARPEAEVRWPRLMRGRHLEAGLVEYGNIKNQITGQMGVRFLLPKSTIDKMRPTMGGKPIINQAHRRGLDPAGFKTGEYDGLAVGGAFDPESGWEVVDFYVWDEATEKNCLENGYELSCAYNITDIDWTPGKHHGIEYDGIILNGDYTHVAVVSDPRYRGASIEAVNSEGGFNLFKLWFKGKDEKPEAVDLDKSATIKIGEKNVPLQELVNALATQDAEAAKITATKAAAEALNSDATEVEVDGKKITVGALKAAYAKIEAKNAEDEADEAKKKKAKEDEEAKNAMCEHDEKKEDCAKCKKEAQNAADADKAKKAKDLEAFNAIKAADAARGGVKDAPVRRNDSQKEAEGSRKYGSPKAAGK